MGLDPISMAVLGIGGAYAASQASKKPSTPAPPSPPAAPQDGLDAAKKTRRYRPAAQLFRDEDLRLGQSGRLGG